MSVNNCVLILPLFFAIGKLYQELTSHIAHAHHLYRMRHQPWPQFKRLLFGKIFQLSYTQVFGIYAGYAYVYTGSFWAAAALHAQCNLFGFPQFSNVFEEEFSQRKRMSKSICSFISVIVVGYLYLVGVILFYNMFGFFYNPEMFEPWFLAN